jgi:hypothetical protein
MLYGCQTVEKVAQRLMRSEKKGQKNGDFLNFINVCALTFSAYKGKKWFTYKIEIMLGVEIPRVLLHERLQSLFRKLKRLKTLKTLKSRKRSNKCRKNFGQTIFIDI